MTDFISQEEKRASLLRWERIEEWERNGMVLHGETFDLVFYKGDNPIKIKPIKKANAPEGMLRWEIWETCSICGNKTFPIAEVWSALPNEKGQIDSSKVIVRVFIDGYDYKKEG